jgi:hypothetical protein
MARRSGHQWLLAAVSVTAAALAFQAGCRAKAPAEGFTAEFVSEGTVHGRVSAQGEALRLEMLGARKSSVAIARYDRGVLWILVPTLGVYRELPLSAWEDRYPNFLRPGLRFEREPVGRSDVDGIPARAWKVRVPRAGGADFVGTLWEAESLPGRPLRWKDEGSGLVVAWRDGRAGRLDPSLFERPPELKRSDAPSRPRPADAPPSPLPVAAGERP